MKGFRFYKTYVIQCDLCNENIVERADETEVDTLAKAMEYAEGHKQQHIQDGSWKG